MSNLNLRGFKYSPQTGIIYRVTNPYQQPQHVGACSRKAGKDGYLAMSCNGTTIRQHRLAAFLMGKTLTKDCVVDHINGDRTDNRWVNLRVTTQQVNAQNQKRHREGSIPGVFFHKTHSKWVARVTVQGKRNYLGYFPTKEAAAAMIIRYINEKKEKVCETSQISP
jgi:hypothetical protein